MQLGANGVHHSPQPPPLSHNSHSATPLAAFSRRDRSGCAAIRGRDHPLVSEIQRLEIRWRLGNNGEPRRGQIMEPLTPATRHTPALSHFLSAFCHRALSAGGEGGGGHGLSCCSCLEAFLHGDVGPRRQRRHGLVCVETRTEEIIWHSVTAFFPPTCRRNTFTSHTGPLPVTV